MYLNNNEVRHLEFYFFGTQIPMKKKNDVKHTFIPFTLIGMRFQLNDCWIVLALFDSIPSRNIKIFFTQAHYYVYMRIHQKRSKRNNNNNNITIENRTKKKHITLKAIIANRVVNKCKKIFNVLFSFFFFLYK